MGELQLGSILYAPDDFPFCPSRWLDVCPIRPAHGTIDDIHDLHHLHFIRSYRLYLFNALMIEIIMAVRAYLVELGSPLRGMSVFDIQIHVVCVR